MTWGNIEGLFLELYVVSWKVNRQFWNSFIEWVNVKDFTDKAFDILWKFIWKNWSSWKRQAHEICGSTKAPDYYKVIK